MKTTRKALEPEFRLKRCAYCKLTFRPILGKKNVRANAERQRFCCRKCKDRFHRNGAMNWERFEERTGKLVKKFVREEWALIRDEIKTELLEILKFQTPPRDEYMRNRSIPMNAAPDTPLPIQRDGTSMV